MEALSIKDLVSLGKTIQQGLEFVPSEEYVTRFYDVYRPSDVNEYYKWKECSIRYLNIYCPTDAERFIKYSEDLEKHNFVPQYMASMVGLLEACDALPSEKMKEQEVFISKASDIRDVEELETKYQFYLKSGRYKINSSETIEAFHKWHAAACVLFDKWFYSSDEDFQRFQNIDASGNGYTLYSEYNKIYSTYCKLINRLKEGRDLKRAIRKYIPEDTSKVSNNQKVKIFISYSHSDAQWLERLKTHLKVLSRFSDSVDYWEDTQLKGGDKWKEQIKEAIEHSNVAILLVSTEFLASDFIATNELPPLLRKAEESGSRILPIIVSPCDYEISELGEFQAINSPEKTLLDMVGDEASIKRVFLSLSKEIQAITRL